ncbi:unnamed protein product, partial [Tetraodon nigroviridis]
SGGDPGPAVPGRPQDPERGSGWTRRPQALSRQPRVRVPASPPSFCVVRSPDHGREHLHALHRRVPAVRGAGKGGVLRGQTLHEDLHGTGVRRQDNHTRHLPEVRGTKKTQKKKHTPPPQKKIHIHTHTHAHAHTPVLEAAQE